MVPERPPAERGFTLIEMMVALAVFAIAALTLLQMEGNSLARTADLDQRLLREVVAQNMAAEILTDPAPPPVGTSSGTIRNAGREFGWVRTVTLQRDAGVLAIRLMVRETSPGAPSQAFTLDFARLPGA